MKIKKPPTNFLKTPDPFLFSRLLCRNSDYGFLWGICVLFDAQETRPHAGCTWQRGWRRLVVVLTNPSAHWCGPNGLRMTGLSPATQAGPGGWGSNSQASEPSFPMASLPRLSQNPETGNSLTMVISGRRSFK